MKTILETQSGLFFDADELAAVKIFEREVGADYRLTVWLKGGSEGILAGEFTDKATAEVYRDQLIKDAWHV